MGTRSEKPRERGGARRYRTAALLHAMQALSQLSYSPTEGARRYASPWVLSTGGQEARSAALRAHCSRYDPCAQRSARSMRASVRSLPSSATVTSIGGETSAEEAATRSGCATLPSPSP